MILIPLRQCDSFCFIVYPFIIVACCGDWLICFKAMCHMIGRSIVTKKLPDMLFNCISHATFIFRLSWGAQHKYRRVSGMSVSQRIEDPDISIKGAYFFSEKKIRFQNLFFFFRNMKRYRDVIPSENYKA